MIRFFQSSVPVSEYFLFDNWSLLCILTVSKPTPPTKSISQRKFKAIDLQALCDEMSTIITMPGVLTRWTTLWNATFQLWLLSFIVKPYYWPRNLQSDLLWLGSIMTLRKNVGRDRKRKWDGVVLVALLILRTFKGRNHTTHLLTKARRTFLQDYIDRNCSNQKDLFLATKEGLETRSWGSFSTV